MTHNLRHQDSLNSSGTISRKTSTASDYTPEHTIFPDKQNDPQEETQEFLVAEIDAQDHSDPIKGESDVDLSARDTSNTSLSTISGDCTVRRDSQPLLNGDHDKDDEIQETSVVQTGLTYAEVAKSPKKSPLEILRSDDDSVSVTSSQYTDTVTSLSDVSSGHSSSSEQRIGHKIELKICLLKNENEEKSEKISEQISPEKKQEQETKLKVPQRKISRFLVSPVLEKLDLPKDKNYGETSEQPPEEIKIDKTEPENESSTQNDVPLQSNLIETDTNETDLKEIAVQNDPVVIEKTIIQQDSLESITITDTEQKDTEGPVCGPEMINTLEQLKISLQNITHAQLATTVAQPATPQPTITQPTKQKQSVVEPPTGLYPVQNDMLLTIDTQSTSSVPTPIITPTLSRQMSHSSTEPGLSTVTTTAPFPNQNQVYVQQEYVENQVYVQQDVFVQPEVYNIQPDVYVQQPVHQNVQQSVQGAEFQGQDVYPTQDTVQQIYVHGQQVQTQETVESSDSKSDLTSEGSNSSVNTPDSTTVQQITSPER